jgi:hypothetical protein
MAAAGVEERQPVLEIYTDAGLGRYVMKPVNKGVALFESSDIKAPASTKRVELHVNVIGHGTLYPFEGPDGTFSMPKMSNPYFQMIMVYENHPKLQNLIEAYREGTIPEGGVGFCDIVKGYIDKRPGTSVADVNKTILDSLDAISVKVKRMVASIRQKAKAEISKTTAASEAVDPPTAASAARGEPTGYDSGNDSDDIHDVLGSRWSGSRRRRRRRPSRKYKKSKRVLRRKSRSTRRR